MALAVRVALRECGQAETLYSCALQALASVRAPGRAWMAAYAMREVLDELEKSAGVGQRGQGLAERVDKLASDWRLTQRVDGDWEVPQSMLLAVDALLKGRSVEEAGRRERARLTVAGLDPTGPESPPAVRDHRTELLMSSRDECNSILHGRPEDADDRTREVLDRFESLVLAWLRPQPSRDFSEIDKFLERGPIDG